MDKRDQDACAQLVTPNKLEYLSLVRSFMTQIASMAGLPGEDAQRLLLAVEEAFANALRYGFEPGVEADVTLRFEAQDGTARVTLAYVGLPFDPEQIPDHTLDTASTPPARGLGLGLMRAFCDKVELRNLGRGHIETVLTKHYAAPDFPERQSPAGPEFSLAEQDYEFRPMRPEEAVEVSRLAFLAYGDSYFYDWLYFPNRIREMNEEGGLRSWVAIASNGEVAAHGALLRESSHSPVAEMCAGITRPGSRGRGCMDGLTRGLLDSAAQIGVSAVFVTAVTSHAYSQKSSSKFGLRECALLLAVAPPARFRAITERAQQRESFLFMMRAFSLPSIPCLYPPPQHAAMIAQIYARLGFTPEYGATGSLPKEGARTLLVAKTHQDLNVGTLTVQEYGPDFVEALRAHQRSFRSQGVHVLRLGLPLANPATAVWGPLAEELGFFFCGAVFAESGGAQLLLQHLGGQFYDYSMLNLATAEGRELTDYIRDKDPMQR